MYKKWLDILDKSILFKGIPSSELNIMLSCINPVVRDYKKNAFVSIEGTPFEGIGIVLSGNAAVTKENASGSRIIMTVLGPGGMFGEMAAFSDIKKWPATVMAQDKCTVLFMPPEKIVGQCPRSCLSHKTLIINMLGVLSQKAFMLSKKLEYISIKSMRGKICNYLLEQHKRTGTDTFMLPMNRNELADFLGVSRPSLSREMGRLKDEGIIDFHRSSVKILDVESLSRMAE